VATYVLGTHTSHDGSACLVRDGHIVVAIEKERVTRRKHDGGDDDDAAVRYCLDAAGLGIGDVDLVVQNDNFHGFEVPRVRGRLVDEARRVVTISHHLAHAHSAIATAPFEEADVLVVDGCGSPYSRCLDLDGATVPEPPPPRFGNLTCEKDSFYAFDARGLVALYKDFSEWSDPGAPAVAPHTTRHSIGGAYLAISTYVFRGLDDPGKLMGLAPYGRPGRVPFELFDLREGRVFVRDEWMPWLTRPARSQAEFEANRTHYADVAWWAQHEIERALLYLVAHRHRRHPAARFCFTGGVAMNAVANHVLRTRTPYREVYVPPAAGDAGLSIGCAHYGWNVVLGGARVAHGGTACLGRRYRREEIDAALASREESVRVETPKDVVEAAAKALVEGKVLAWFQGGSEFGPRALGHRSILALPTRADLGAFVNARIKFREDFRPFAPSVPAEWANRCFEMEYESPFMNGVAPTRMEWRDRIPAVVHVDGSARVQTVHEALDPLFHALHVRVEALSGIPVLLNTSLNRRGMPIVETPREAIDFLLETALDALVLEDRIVEKVARRDDATEGGDYAKTLDLLEARMAALPAREHGPCVNLVVTGLEDALVLHVGARRIEPGSARHPDWTVRCSARTLGALATGEIRLDAALARGLVEAPGLRASEASLLAERLRPIFPGDAAGTPMPRIASVAPADGA